MNSRTGISASRCDRAWTPAPRIASDVESSRASARVAEAVTAAVRISVIADASRIAVGTPVSPSNRVTIPWWASRPRAGLARIRQIALSANTALSAPWSPRQPGINPISPAAPGGNITDRSGMNASPRAWAASTAVIACSHSSGGSDSSTSAWLRIRTWVN